LSSTSELVEYFLKNNYKNDLIQPDGVAHEFCEILNALWDADQKIISPYKLRNMIGVTNRNFLSNDQQDSHELMIFLLEAIHKELNKVKKYTSIYF
jgi:ubiquitin C-terminal hydrolase